MHNVVVEVAEIGIRRNVHLAQTGADDAAVSTDELDLLLTRLHALDRLGVHARLAVERLEEGVGTVDVDLDALAVLGENDGEVDGVLGVLPADGLAQVVTGAGSVLEQGAVPHGAGEVAIVERENLSLVLGVVLVGGDEGGDDVLPGRVVEVIDVLLGGLRGGDGLLPDITDVVRLASVVPGEEHDELGAELEDLLHAVGQGEFTAAVPVAEAVNVLELVGGEG